MMLISSSLLLLWDWTTGEALHGSQLEINNIIYWLIRQQPLSHLSEAVLAPVSQRPSSCCRLIGFPKNLQGGSKCERSAALVLLLSLLAANYLI